MLVLLKIFPYIIPFLKEMILGKKTWSQAFKDNKKKTLFAALVIGSFGLNFILVPKLTTLGVKYVNLNREYLEYKTNHPNVASTQKYPINNGKEVTAEVRSTPVREEPPKKPPAVPVKEVVDEIKAEFERMRLHEANEH